jgi:hypothetical protein
MKLLIMVSMILIVGYFLGTNAYGLEKITNKYFSINIPDNWINQKSEDSLTSPLLKIAGSSVIVLAPPVLGNFSVTNDTSELSQNMQIAGAICIFGQDQYNFSNYDKLEDYVRAKTLNQDDLKVISLEETTIGNERAVRIYADGVGEFANFKYIEYLMLHDKKPYFISYAARVADYYAYLSEFDKIVKSLTFID